MPILSSLHRSRLWHQSIGAHKRSPMNRCLLTVAISAGMSLVPLVGIGPSSIPQAAAAVHDCTSVATHFFDGFVTKTSTVIGTSAHIINRLGARVHNDNQ